MINITHTNRNLRAFPDILQVMTMELMPTAWRERTKMTTRRDKNSTFDKNGFFSPSDAKKVADSWFSSLTKITNCIWDNTVENCDL